MTKTKWCGCIIFGKDIRHDHVELEGPTKMECATADGLLQQYQYSLQWLRSATTQFQSLVSNLYELLKHVYAHGGKRSKRPFYECACKHLSRLLNRPLF